MLVLSNRVLLWRWMTSFMRGCCHLPGVEAAEDGVVGGVEGPFPGVLPSLVRARLGKAAAARLAKARVGVCDVVAGAGELSLGFSVLRTSDITDMLAGLDAPAVLVSGRR